MSIITEIVKVTGDLVIQVIDENGSIKESHYIKNLVVDAGKALIASRLVGTASAAIGYIELGSGTATANSAQTTLVTPLANYRSSGTVSSSGVTATISASFSYASTVTVTEAGIFNASSGGTMLCRTVFPAITKLSTDTLTVTWNVTIS